MAKCSRYMARVLRVIGFVLSVQIVLACALIPNEHEGLLGRFLMASQEKVDEMGMASLEPSSVSYVFPVGAQKDKSATTGKQNDGITQEKPHMLSASLDFVHGFVAAISVIIVSELGDKTFFIAAIMSMRHSRLVVFTGAMMALGLMTVLSAVLGYATTIIPRKYTLYISSALFLFFGLKMLKEGFEMDPNEGQEELEEVQAELKKQDEELSEEEKVTQDPETGVIRGGKKRRFISPILLQSFTLTFLAEWGDRSQLATILLGSRENVIGVILGGTIGHGLCTGLAVIGGRMIAQRISVKT
ncbi:hypothetical protein QZH41_013076, partial [Actinostola sp. cb2023]